MTGQPIKFSAVTQAVPGEFFGFKFFSRESALKTPYSVIKPPVINSDGVTSKQGFQQLIPLKTFFKFKTLSIEMN